MKDSLRSNIDNALSFLPARSVYFYESGSVSRVLSDSYFDSFEPSKGKINHAYEYLLNAVNLTSVMPCYFVSYDEESAAKGLGDKRLILGDDSNAVVAKNTIKVLFGYDERNIDNVIGKTLRLYQNNEFVSEVLISGIYEAKKTPSFLAPIDNFPLNDSYIFCPSSACSFVIPDYLTFVYSEVSFKEYSKSQEDRVHLLCEKYGTEAISYHDRVATEKNKYAALFSFCDAFSILSTAFSFTAHFLICFTVIEMKEKEFRIYRLFAKNNVEYVLMDSYIVFFFLVPLFLFFLSAISSKLILIDYVGGLFFSPVYFIPLVACFASMVISLVTLNVKHSKTCIFMGDGVR